ncbi:MAG: diacylglycerol kinase family protein [Raoultibacter sp.]
MKTGHKRFVRNAHDKSEGKSFSFPTAFACALHGLAYAFASQRNMKIHLVGALLAVVLGVVFGIAPAEWAVIALCIAVVFACECMNTALEAVVDLVSPEYSELAKHAKDCAAGAVLVCAFGSLVVAACIFLPRIISLIGF